MKSIPVLGTHNHEIPSGNWITFAHLNAHFSREQFRAQLFANGPYMIIAPNYLSYSTKAEKQSDTEEEAALS